MSRRYIPCLLLLATPLCTPLTASASEAYLCAQLDRIRGEENVPAIGAGLVLPDPSYPQYSALQFITLTCASGVEIYGSPTKVTKSTQFGIGSISKPLSGLIVARVIANESTKPNPKLTWNTRLIDFFPHIANLPNSNPCYYQRTVADLMSHSSGMPSVPLGEPNDQWVPVEPNAITRRAMYVDAAVVDPPVVPCFNPRGQPLPQLQASYGGGVIIASHMAEIVTGRSWEDLVRHAGSTTAGPGLMIGLLPDPSIAPYPYAYGHSYGFDGIPVVSDSPKPAPTNGPAGNIIPTLPQFARILTEFLDATSDDANRQLPDGERAGLYTQHGLSSYSRLGWQVRSLNSTNFGNVAAWSQPQSLFHNGITGAAYSEAYLVPHQNAAMFSLVTADGPFDSVGNVLITNRPDAMKKIFAELTALRLHHGLAADIVHTRKPATVAVNGASSSTISKLGDGRLSSKWVASSTTTPLTITLTYDQPTSIDRIVIAEDGAQNIREYELAYQDSNNAWHVIAANQIGQDLIFPHRVFEATIPPPQFELFGSPSAITAKKLRLRVLSASAPPQIVEFAGADMPNQSRYVPLWWRKGFAEALPYPGPVLDDGSRYEPAPIFDVIRTFDPSSTLQNGAIVRGIGAKTISK